MNKEKTIESLMESIKFFREQYLSSAYSIMGFSVVSVGWLITSASAQNFIHDNSWLGICAILLLIASYIGYWKISFEVQSISQNLADNLAELNVKEYLYKHYFISRNGVRDFILLQGLATLLITLIVIAIL